MLFVAVFSALAFGVDMGFGARLPKGTRLVVWALGTGIFALCLVVGFMAALTGGDSYLARTFPSVQVAVGAVYGFIAWTIGISIDAARAKGRPDLSERPR